MAGTSMVLAAVHGSAQSSDKFYLDVVAGPAWQQNDAIKVSSFGNSGHIEFDTGTRADLRLGYDLCPHFSAELESGFTWNAVHNIHTPFGDDESSALGYSADLYEVPMLVNLVYRPLRGAFQPYIGVGCGGAVGFFDSSNIPLYSSNFAATDWTFAYQGEAGFKYQASRHVEVGLAYEFLGTTDHSWSDSGYSLKTNGTKTHAVLATLSWRF